MRQTLTFILAGGKGERLNPLTRDRAKPAVPFGGIYRIIDFTLSNCVNSGLRRIYLLIQYKSFSLQKHILAGWDVVSNQLGEFIDVIPAQQRIGTDWYKGTADAIYQNIYAIHDHDPDLILILAGDHVYKMNYQKLLNFHRQMGADMVLPCIPMPASASQELGVVEVDEEGKVCGFQEKPKNPKTIPGYPDRIYASMGIYLFGRHSLIEELKQDAHAPLSEHDFGKNIIPQMIKNGKKIYLYKFVDDKGEPQYWRDIGTRDAYYQANMDLLKPEPEFNLYDKSWPVRTFHEQYPPIKLMNTFSEGKKIEATVDDSLIAGGCILKGAQVHGSVISQNVHINANAKIQNSVIMEGVEIGEGAKVQNAILDKQVIVAPGETIGYDLDKDKKRFDVTRSGIVIVEKRVEVG